MPRTEEIHDLHGRAMLNIVSGETFHIYDKNSSGLPKPPGWLSLRTMGDEVNHILSRAESKFCAPNIHRLGGRGRSVNDVRGRSPGPGGRDLPRVRKSS